MKPEWLKWAAELQSIAQAGLTFGADTYDLDRYEKIRNIAVDILNKYTGIDHSKVRELFASETGYQTPKVDIRASVILNNRILLVREKVDGAWSLPGGWADVGSSVRESAVRECLEEAGAKVDPKRIIAVQVADRHNVGIVPFTIYKIFVECELLEKVFAENTETFDADFFGLENLPELSLPRTTREQIEMCMNAKKIQTLEPLFD
jgi:ADP-ribose pyrophosphatase YjhB (NUDIX family)